MAQGTSPADLRRRAKAAFAADTEVRDLHRRVQEFAIPGRAIADRGKPDRSFDRVYDSTLAGATHRLAGQVQNAICPPFQPWFALKPGPLVAGDDVKAQLQEQLNDITAVVQSVFARGDFHLATHEMLLDGVVGTGAMLVLKGNSRNPVMFCSVPAMELGLEEDGYGRVCGIFWRRKYRAHQILSTWPDAVLTKDFRAGLDKQPDAELEVLQATVRVVTGETSEWRHFVLIEDGDVPPAEASTSQTCPWIIFRWSKAPGEVLGRGPAMLAFPSSRALNRAVELNIKAAQYGILGVWSAVDDGVFNPDTSPMFPGAMLMVRRNGGPMGETLRRLDIPARVDLSQLILEDLRTQVKELMHDKVLPPQGGAPRSPTEIVENMRKFNEGMSGALGRLTTELCIPLVQRVVEVLFLQTMLQTSLQIDDFLIKGEVTSPLAQASQAETVGRVVDWAQMSQQLVGPELFALAAPVDAIPGLLAGLMNVPPQFVRTEQDRAQQTADAEAAAQAQAAAQAEAEAPPPDPFAIPPGFEDPAMMGEAA